MKWIMTLAVVLFSATAQASIGTITEFSGAATIKRGSTVLTAAKGTAIEQNDRVETRNGKLKITFQDATTVTVAEHSNLIIDDFVYDPASSAGKLGLRAAGGTVRYVSGAIAHKNPRAVNIRTPTAAIAVRGTDFVMSVNEIGSSMIILMPSCETGVGPVECGSGAIDVESGPNVVSMNRPFQATMVESAGQPPSPPITVNLFGTPVGNNLQITPPRTASGISVVAAARSAAQATGVIKTTGSGTAASSSGGSSEAAADAGDATPDQQLVASGQDDAAPSAAEQAEEQKQEAAAETTQVSVETDLVPEPPSAPTVELPAPPAAAAPTPDPDPAPEPTAEETPTNPYLIAKWADSSKTVQTGWIYESLSPSKKHYANIGLGLDTTVTVWVSQDGESHGYAFGTQGRINIIQRSGP